jgi:hypothetical protein
MPRISMKLTASLVGSLALLFAAACERNTQTTPEPGQGSTGAAQDPNSMRPTPGTSTPGNTASPSGTSAPSSTSTPSSSTSSPSASAHGENPDTVPVRGTDPDMQGGGGASGAGGHGGQGGHSGHGGKTSR